MIGSDRLLQELSRLVKRSSADATSACAHASTRRVKRFAYEAIHQDLVQESLTISIKVVIDKRTGVASTNLLEPASLERCRSAALEIARHAPPAKQVPALPADYQLLTTQDYVAPTINVSPAELVKIVKRLFHLTKGLGVQLAGSMVVGEDELAVVNSERVSCYAASTVCGAKLVTMRKKLSGYASGVARRISQLNPDRLLERALKQCLHRHAPVTMPTGTYEVILEPEAVAELVMWLGYIAFGAKSFQERTSCLAGRMGDQLVAKGVSIFDDGNDTDGLRMPFDFEGVAKQHVRLIDKGAAAGIVYDTTYGLLYGQPSTGHAGPPDEIDGPVPTNLFMEAGSQRHDELIRTCSRGLLIPRFHYVSGLLNPREALMTGLTREGAFLIEDGKLAAPITTLRFTQSSLEAVQRVVGVSKERQVVADPAQNLGCAVMPTLRLAKFRFTGRSES